MLERLAGAENVRRELDSGKKEEWTIRERSRVNSPIHKTSRQFPLSEEDTESIIQPVKRCQTDSGLSPV